MAHHDWSEMAYNPTQDIWVSDPTRSQAIRVRRLERTSRFVNLQESRYLALAKTLMGARHCMYYDVATRSAA